MSTLGRSLSAAIGGLLLCTNAVSGQQLAVTSRPSAATDSKSPALAGVLSAWIPGLGSFYAGDPAHGIIHLGVAGASYGAMMAAALTDCPDKACRNRYDAIGVAGIGVFAGNYVWSIFTAVRDAHAYNRAHSGAPGHIAGDLYFSPDFSVSPKRASIAEIRVLTWRY